mgnify:CR=1 FL=1|tara:strand:+ start:920 stop:2365 length:1446 start_codon:yes stop_codon:yes gene_type:complete
MNTTKPLTTTTKTPTTTKPTNDEELHGLCHLSAVLSRGATMKPDFFIRYYNKYYNLVNEFNKNIYIPPINSGNKDKYIEIFERMYKYPVSMYTGISRGEDKLDEDIGKLQEAMNQQQLECHTFKHKNTKCILIIDKRIKKIFICYSSVVWEKIVKSYPNDWQQAIGEPDNSNFPWFKKIIQLLNLGDGDLRGIKALPTIGIITTNMIKLIKESDIKDIICTGHGIAGCLAEITALMLAKQEAMKDKKIIVANWSTPAWLPKSKLNDEKIKALIRKVNFYKFTTHGDLYPEMPRVCDSSAKKDELTYKRLCSGFSNPSGYVKDIITYEHIGVDPTNTAISGKRTINPNNYLVYSVGYDKINTLFTNKLLDNFIIKNAEGLEKKYPDYKKTLEKNERNGMAGLRLGFIYGKLIHSDKDGNNWWYNKNNKRGKLEAPKSLKGGRRKTRKRRKRKGGKKSRKNKRKTRRRKSKKRRRRTRRRKRR